MTVNACADLVRRGDPDRFAAAMAAPPAARAVLFPIYAFNLEVARAPYIVSEPMLAEIRLQWWRDALDEIARGATPRAHEVVKPLAAILDAEGCAILDRVVAARRWDIARDPFPNRAALLTHLQDSAGALMWAAARALGAEDEAAVRGVGLAGGVAAWLVAVPALVARGMQPLPDDDIPGLAGAGLSALGPVSRAARPAALAASEAGPVLRRAIADPARVRAGTLARAQFLSRARLLRRSLGA